MSNKKRKTLTPEQEEKVNKAFEVFYDTTLTKKEKRKRLRALRIRG